MGCLLAVGTGSQSPAWMQQVLDARRREVAAPTFPADGLYFLGPTYDAAWGLPNVTPALGWLPDF
jgi:tRNA pseudouridine38-40 synthase